MGKKRLGIKYSSVNIGQGAIRMLTNRERKLRQRQEYKAAFKKCKHGHGGSHWIRKKEQAALGSSSSTKGV